MKFKIREVRKSIGMSQTELATKSGVSRTIISGLETGEIDVTTTKTLINIAAALNRKVSDIFFEDIV